MIRGAATGSTTNMRRCRMVQPSILAESSMSSEISWKYPHLWSAHLSTLPAVGETGETALEWAPRPSRRERSVLAAREDLSRHLGSDDPHPKGLSATLGSRPVSCPAARAVEQLRISSCHATT
jgi:hypothetical protein